MNNLFITPDKVLNFTQLGVNFPEDDVRNAILYAQRTIVQRRIGSVLYNRLQADIENNSTPNVAGSAFSGAYSVLMDDYIGDLLIQSAFYELQAIAYVRPTSSGFVQPNATPQSSSASESVYRQKRKITEEKINFFDKRLTEYLNANKSSFPELAVNTAIASDMPDLSITNSINPIHISGNSKDIDSFLGLYPNTKVFSEPKRRYN